MDIGVQQQVLQGKGTLKATVTDVLGTFHWAGTSNTTGQTVRVNGGWESRQFRINFSYRFGSNQVKSARQRKAGSEDEDKRTQGGGGLGVGGN